MPARFIFAPITIAVLALTATTPAEEKPAPVPLKKFRVEPAGKKPGDIPWSKPEPWIGQGPFAAQADGTAGKKSAEPSAAKPAAGSDEKPAPAPAATEPAKPAEGEPDVPRAIMVTKRELTAQLQIFLDQQLFSPGMIDGKPGKFVTNALKRWQRAHALPETGEVNENVPLDSVFPVYTFHTVAKSDYKFVGNLSGKTAEQSRQKSLPYPGYTDFLAERYHCSTEFLAKLNPKVSFGKLQPGDQVRVPNVAPFKVEDMPDTGNLPEKEEFKNRRIVITRKDTILELFEGDNLIAAIPIAPGSPGHPTPAGKWRILGIASMPTFRWDAGVLNSGVRTNNFFNLPPGPRNPVGVAWMGLNKPGIGIHGTNNPHSIGTFASHGCMRTANWDISRICHMVTAGVTVEIR